MFTLKACDLLIHTNIFLHVLFSLYYHGPMVDISVILLFEMLLQITKYGN